MIPLDRDMEAYIAGVLERNVRATAQTYFDIKFCGIKSRVRAARTALNKARKVADAFAAAVSGKEGTP